MTDTHQKEENCTPDLIGELRELAKSCGYEHGTPTGMAAWKAAAEIERLRAKLTEARAVIEPFADRHEEIMQITSGRRVAATYVDTVHLRAAETWVEKNR